MCNDCSSYNLNRREFIGGSIKASGLMALTMAAGIPAIGSGLFSDGNTLSSLSDETWTKIKKEPAKVMVVFLYPPADVVNAGKNEDSWASNNWFTWPGNQFEPEAQEKVFTSRIRTIANALGIEVEFAVHAIYQQAKVEEYIRKAKSAKPDAVLVVNFWNTFKQWSLQIAVESAPAAIVYQPVGSNHQLPMAELRNTKGIFYIHSIENWDEIERGLLAVRAKKMLSQSRLLRISDQKESVSRANEKFLHVDVLGIRAEEFNQVFDSVKADDKLLKEAAWFRKKAGLIMDVEDKYIVEAVRSHHAVGKIMERYGADAITIQCLMLKHRKPCVSFSINNGNLIPCGCENHLDGVLTQMVGRWLFERAGFMHNPEFDTSENLYFGSHCTCATKLQGPKGPDQEFLIRPFFHQLPKTAALDVQWTPNDPVMLTKYHSGENRISCWTGKVVSSPKSPPTGGCATRVLVEVDKVDDICDVYAGPHPILFWGNRGDARKVKAFAQMYHLDLGGNV
jgi:hypothetical protein